MYSNNCCREKHGTREITLDEMKFEARLRHFIKQIHIPFGHPFKYSILFTFEKQYSKTLKIIIST